MKKIFEILLGLILMSNTTFAMTFSQPVEIGKISHDMSGRHGNGYIINGALKNDGDYYKRYKKNSTSYGKGVAQFGSDQNILCVHYDMYNSSNNHGKEKFGSINILNSVDVPIWEGATIFQIKNDSKIKMYMIFSGYGSIAHCFIIGERDDGKFVKYIDTESITEKYFGTDKNFSIIYFGRKMFCRGNQVIIPYTSRYLIQTHPLPKYEIREGEFRFKWDDRAQWFGIEQIIY